MKSLLGNISLAVWLALFVAGGGCTPGAGTTPVAKAPATEDGSITFDDLAVVLAAVVDQADRIDATALAVQLPRLQRQLRHLGRPWPANVSAGRSDARLAWLYNARMAWSLKIVSDELRPLNGRADTLYLPKSIDRKRLLATEFHLAGAVATIEGIDRELAQYDDFRLAASAPCASDLAGPLAMEPFTAQTVRTQLPERFNHTFADNNRVVVDHDGRRLYLPPAMWAQVPLLTAQYNRRFNTHDATFPAAVGPYLDVRGRDRMADAMGYEVVPRTGPAGIVAKQHARTPLGRVLGH